MMDTTTADATDVLAIMAKTEALLAAFTGAVEAIAGAGEDGSVKRLADGMADILKAVARKIDAA
jgi:hypothetical protein